MLNPKTFALTLVLLAASAGPSLAQESQLLGVLKSDASLEAKSAACRQLARIATKESVPTLASLLGDEKLSHMARYALETIPDPSVDEALRAALGTVPSRPRLGVIGSLGMRRDGKAVGAIAKLLTAADGETVQAAARALGNIGTTEAAKALDAALTDGAGANQQAICEGLLRCAESLSAQSGQDVWPKSIYRRLRQLPQAPKQVRAAAVRGAILSYDKSGHDGALLLVETIRGSDAALTAVAARTAMEMRGAAVTAVLAAELPKLSASKQVLVINTLGYRGDSSAGPALLAVAASNASVAVRLAAVENLTHLGFAPALPLLAELSLMGEDRLANAARTCLGNFPGKEADAAIRAMLTHHDAKVRSLALQLIGQRNIPGATASLLKAAEDSDETVRQAAFKALRQQASAADLAGLLKVLVNARSSDMPAAEGALLALCGRESKATGGNVVILQAIYGAPAAGLTANVTRKVAALVKAGTLAIDATNDNFGDPADGHVKQLHIDYKVNGVRASLTVPEGETLTLAAIATPPAVVDAICSALQGARGKARLALLRSLRTAGGAKSLAAIRTAMADSDPQVKETAQHILCDWPTPDALPAIGDLAGAPPTPTMKVLALRGLVRLLPQADLPVAKRFEMLKGAMAAADRDDERQLVLSALGSVPDADALTLVASCLDNPVLREESCIAAVAIAEKLNSSHDSRVAAVMKQVAKLSANKELAARADAVARRAEK
jgi:HEAT repeat protein